MQPKDTLILKAAAIAKTHPELWRGFTTALAAYTEVHRENLIKSPLNELPVNQGRAQSLANLTTLLANSVENADKITKGK